MKIEKINSYLARNQFIVEVITDNGISGVGQSACWAYPEAVKAIVEKFNNVLIGKNPFMIEEINQLLMRSGPFRGSVLSGAISCIDIALWDIKGKYFETPIWNLLGGKVRNKIRLHLLLGIIYGNSKSKNEGLYESAKKAVKDGGDPSDSISDLTNAFSTVNAIDFVTDIPDEVRVQLRPTYKIYKTLVLDEGKRINLQIKSSIKYLKKTLN